MRAGLLRMQQAGVILSDYATLAMEILKDNASTRMQPRSTRRLLTPFAVLVGQIAHAFMEGKVRVHSSILEALGSESGAARRVRRHGVLRDWQERRRLFCELAG